MKLFSFSGFFLLTLLMMNSRSCDDPLFDGKSCTNDCYVVQGRVTDAATAQGIPNVDLKFYYNTGKYSLFGNRRLLVKAKTNQIGVYYITFDGADYKKADGRFSLHAEHPTYFISALDKSTSVASLYPDSMTLDEPVPLNFVMFWPGYIKLRISAGSTTAATGLSFKASHGKPGVGYGFTIKPNLDTTVIIKTASGVQTNIHWYTYPQATKVEKKDSVTVARDATLEYGINL